MSEVRHWIVDEPHKSFLVCNDDGGLTTEPVTLDDITPIGPNASLRLFESWAWSSNVRWFFIVLDRGIALFRVGEQNGFMCHKKSADFFRLFLETPSKLVAA